MLEGVRAFEAHEADVVERAGATLLAAAGNALTAVAVYYGQLAEQIRAHGITTEAGAEDPIPDDRGIPGHGGPLLLLD